MGVTINWLHLTDLHFGLDVNNWLWPKVKHDFLKDVEKHVSKLGGCDIVFFTGDFVQAGKSEEFRLFNVELALLWKQLEKGGRTPQLCVVPGNHDLVRPDATSSVARSLVQLWEQDSGLREQFWTDPKCEYRQAVDTFFENYTAWCAGLSVPVLSGVKGLLPGDFSATFEKEKVKLGIVGLNSTFLQIAKGDYSKKLDLHISQLNTVCEGDPEGWMSQRTATVLLTHQPPNWLSPRALAHFRKEIYPPGRFVAQLCGHQHDPGSYELSEAGAEQRRLRQGPSLFGLEKWEGPDAKERIHGYTIGQYLFERTDGVEKYWPRITTEVRAGGYNFAPDYTFKLQDDGSICSRFSCTTEADTDAPSSSAENSEVPASDSPRREEQVVLPLLEGPTEEQTARTRLGSLPRMHLRAQPQHRYVRLDEQAVCEAELRRSRAVWLVADWAAEEGFIGACIERFRDPTCPPDAFHIRCGEAADVDEFENLFPQQCGLALMGVCALLAPLNGAFLILDGVHPALCTGEFHRRFRDTIDAVLDYCQNLRIICVSGIAPADGLFPIVKLQGLDVPDVRVYLTHHPDAEPGMQEADVVELLHERSEGLPAHLDKLLKALKVSSLAVVLESDMDTTATARPAAIGVPSGLIQAVARLTGSEDTQTRRSSRLLQVLSVLPYGETLDTLSHYLPTEPFFIDNANQLRELALLDAISLLAVQPQVGGIRASTASTLKLLKAPRQVRDYVLSLMSDGEREGIVRAGIERFFGRAWWEGRIKLRTIPIEYREYLSHGPGNEFALIHYFITMAKGKGDTASVSRGVALAIHYLNHLYAAHRYRDTVVVGRAFVQLLDRDLQTEEWASTALILGQALRMTRYREEALQYLRAAVETSTLTNGQMASAWLNIAEAENTLKNTESATAAVVEIMKYASEDSSTAFQAQAILLSLTLKGDQKVKALGKLEKKVKEHGHTTMAENIALELARVASHPEEKIKHLDKVLTPDSEIYNRSRAIVLKAEIQRARGELLKPQEIRDLAATYSYLHSQRFSDLFDRCHDLLWTIFESRSESAQLLRLFRHSSFLWRIRGNSTKEVEYLRRLDQQKVKEQSVEVARGLMAEIAYFFRRVRAVLVGG